MKNYFVLLILSVVFFIRCGTKKINDFSQTANTQKIIYDTLSLTKIKPIFSFPKTLNENSGIEADGNFIWTFNDSGGKNSIYKVDFTGKIIQEIEITNAKNHDWEDITADENFIYIGDFGNNNGNRQNLAIYKLKKDNITTKPFQKHTAQVITFEYDKRTDFSKKPYDHDFDCESIFIYQNQIHLLTKAWKTGISSHYVLPTSAGHHTAKFLEKLDTHGFLTAADVSKKHVSAVQYTRDGEVTLWDFYFDKKGLLFQNPIRATYLGNTQKLGQIEGLMFFKNKQYLSGEQMNDIAPTLYLIQQ